MTCDHCDGPEIHKNITKETRAAQVNGMQRLREIWVFKTIFKKFENL
jgi:hypothetical protein